MNAPRWSRASVIASDIALALDVNKSSIGKPAQTAARDNEQRKELAKGGERTQTAANEFSRVPASQPRIFICVFNNL